LRLAAFISFAAIDHFVMPPIAPVAWGNDSRPLWQVETAFLLRALENIAAMVVIGIVLLATARYIQRRLQPDTQP
jgi:hypothetical protein